MNTNDPASTPWQQRAMLRPILDHARQPRWLEKPVHDALLIDDMEQERGWVASSTVELAYTNERAKAGTQSLRLRTTLRDAAYIAANRLPNGSFTGAGPYAAVDIDIP